MNSGSERLQQISGVLWRILWLNLVVAIAKLVYGLYSGAIAITADGLHSLLDAASNVLGLVGISVARRPPDENHPYGHRKYETFAALGIVHVLACLLVPRLPHPPAPAENPHKILIA